HRRGDAGRTLAGAGPARPGRPRLDAPGGRGGGGRGRTPGRRRRRPARAAPQRAAHPRPEHRVTEPEVDLVSPLAAPDERDIEVTLRPRRLAEFVGQPRVREQLSLVLESALRRGRPPDHVLLSGAPGLGKTTMAMIIAAELGAPIRITSGPAIERAGDLAALLSTLSEGEVLFL